MLAVVVFSELVRPKHLEDCWKELGDNASQRAGVKCAMRCCGERKSSAVRRCNDGAVIESRLGFAVQHQS